MLDLLLNVDGEYTQLELAGCDSSSDLFHEIAERFGITLGCFFLSNDGNSIVVTENSPVDELEHCSCLHVRSKGMGGIDFQNRVGSKIGSGGHLSESEAATERKERLRKLALETIDITKVIGCNI